MKKIIALGVFASVALLAFYSRDLLDIYHLLSYAEKTTAAYQADGGAWPHLTDVCAGCHGVQGSTPHQRYPSLAGQPAPYIATQLRNFASGQRANPNMGPLAMTLSAEEIKQLSEYFASKSAKENSYFVADAGLREKGRQLVAGAGCAGCHGAGLMGHEQYPRLAGQGYDYLVAQLDAFAAGTRTEPLGVMKSLASAASPADRKAIAQYLAGLSPATK